MLRLLCFLSFISTAASAQFQNVLIDGSGGNEPSIAVDPKNPAHLVAGSNLDNFYTSSDSGKTWLHGRLQSTYGNYGDPVIIADSSGAFYFFHLSNITGVMYPPLNSPGWVDRMVCQRLDNLSGSWTTGSAVGLDSPKVQDKPGVAYDRNKNTIYLSWTQFDRYASLNHADSSVILFSSSPDRGTTWTAPVRVSTKGGDCLDEDNTVEGAVPCVGPGGEVYLAWASTDGIVFKKSVNGGQTWPANETLVTTVPGGWDYDIPGIYRCNGLPYTFCDLSSSPHRGNIYINWTDQRNGTDNTDVWLCRSTDGGGTWSAPIRVNDDTGTRQQFMSSMTVDQSTGYIYIVFYDRRNYVDIRVPNLSTDVYMAVSKDGGITFKNILVSESFFKPQSSVFFGDYTAITAVNGHVFPIWTRMDVSKTSIWTAIVDSAHMALGVSKSKPLSTGRLNPLYPNPFSSGTTIPFNISTRAHISLYVTDIWGRTVSTLHKNEEMPPGNYTENFNARSLGLQTGMYFFILETETSRMVQRAMYEGH